MSPNDHFFGQSPDQRRIQDQQPGYHGRYLRVDLTRGTADSIDWETGVLRNFLGGSGLGTYLMFREGTPECDAFDPESSLAFVFSPLVGSPLTTSAKFAVVSKSPLTDRINDSLASSAFAISGKQTGHDAIVIRGRAQEPTVLVIDNENVHCEPAGELSGLPCRSVQRQLKQRLGNDWQIAVIGPAGERLVRYATISHDGRHAGRGGSGAVMGSKNLKAIAVRGSTKVTWSDQDGLIQLSKDLAARSLGPATAKYRELGTSENLLLFNRLKIMPTHNFQQGSLAGVEQLAPETLRQSRKHTRTSCAACTIGCEHIYALNGDPDISEFGVRVEYENLFALGPLCGINDSEVVLKASAKCDQLGIDTISAGGTIAFGMECAQRGLWNPTWLRFGDGQALLQALDMIGNGDGVGKLLAEGSRRLADHIGQNSIEFAPQVKGLEIPGYEPRAMQTMALGFAVGTRGADHNRSGAYEVDFSEQVNRRAGNANASALAVKTEDQAALMDSLILCKFLRGVFQDFHDEAVTMINLVTGWDITPTELQQTAQRIVTAKKLFNIRSGWQPDEDCLPARMMENALSDDPVARLSKEQLSQMIVHYNRTRGWTDDGWLPHEILKELDLSEL